MRKTISLVVVSLLCFASLCYGAMHENQWSPDTCGCVITYQWDDSLPADQRVHTVKDIIVACPEHQSLSSDKANHYAKVLDENVRKNKTHGQLLTISNLTETVIQKDGSSVVQFKNGMGFNYTWSGTGADRILNITVFGYNLTLQQKNIVQNWCNNNLGIGKVVIN